MRIIKILVLGLTLSLSFFFCFNLVMAEDTAKVIVPVLQVTILDFGSPIDFTSGYTTCSASTGATSQNCIQFKWIGQYIKAIFQYGVMAAVILTVIMIMAGGFLWLTAGGSPDRVSKGKDFITSALVGMFLALFSYLILTIVNPNLVNIKSVSVNQVAQKEIICCVKIESGKRTYSTVSVTSDARNCPQGTSEVAITECQEGGERGCCTVTKGRTVPGSGVPVIEFSCYNGVLEATCASYAKGGGPTYNFYPQSGGAKSCQPTFGGQICK